MRVVQVVSGCGLLLGSMPVLAQQGAAQEVSAGVGSAQLLTVLMSLILVVLLIFSLAWLVRRLGIGGGLLARSAVMKIIATLPLGTRERLVIIEVGGKQLLLGVTAHSIQTLHTFDESLALPEKAPVNEAFAEKLMAVMAGEKKKSAAGKENKPAGDQPQ